MQLKTNLNSQETAKKRNRWERNFYMHTLYTAFNNFLPLQQHQIEIWENEKVFSFLLSFFYSLKFTDCFAQMRIKRILLLREYEIKKKNSSYFDKIKYSICFIVDVMWKSWEDFWRLVWRRWSAFSEESYIVEKELVWSHFCLICL